MEGQKGHKHVEHENALKPAIVQDCNRHMGYMDRSDCM